MVRRSAAATVNLASSGRPMTFGTIRPAISAIIASTTIISISVKPASAWLTRRESRSETREVVL